VLRGVFHAGRVAVIKGSGFMNSEVRGVEEIREIKGVVESSPRLVRDSSDRRRSEGVRCVSCYN
jgi:hypothetical protein